jgi:hypothetical protein
MRTSSIDLPVNRFRKIGAINMISPSNAAINPAQKYDDVI